MKLSTQKKASSLGFKKPFRKEIKLTIISLLVLTFQISTAIPLKKVSSDRVVLSLTKRIIKGKVTDSNGVPLPGANVLIKGTTIGVQTDYNGEFAIEIADNQTVLVISYIGMQEQEVTIGKDPIIVALREVGQQMNEVVIVGYSKIKKESLTGALQTLNSKKLIDATTPSVENLLSGKATGVYVSSGSGQPGDVGKIVIRGKTTVNGSTDPLWVIDGVIVGSSSGNINPADIETLTVLKDAASTAVYGSQGANGVIVVTTKSGKSGKATINASIKVAATTVNNGNFSIMNGQELYDLYNTFPNKQDFSNTWWWKPELRNKNYDWWKNATQTGIAKDFDLSISGGSDTFKSYVSLGVYDETGAIRGYDYTRYNLLLKFSYKANNWLTIRPQANITRTGTEDKQHSVGAMYENMPWDSPYLENGTLVGNQPNPTWVNTTGSNYLYDLQWNYGESQRYSVRTNLDFDIKFSSWLTFTSTNNYIFSNGTSMDYTDPRSSGGLSVNGRIGNNDDGYNRFFTNQLLTFNKSFGAHAINAIFAYEWDEYNSKSSEGIATGLAPGSIIPDVAAIPEKVGGTRSQWAVQSLLSNINYTYADRYMAQFSIRRDGASNFGKNARYGNFFSISGGWNIHKEKFFKASYINNLKLRASYGSVGNRPNSLYPHQTLYSLASSTSIYNGNSGAIISQIGNPDLSWEKTYTTGIGLDVSFFNRINLTLDYYDKNTSGLLYQVPLPAVIGVTSIWRNVGAVNNRGFEASINVDIIKNENWRWNVDANIAVNKNKVTSLYGTKQEIIVGDGSGIAGSASKLLKPGLDVDTWYLPEWAGVNSENGKPEWYKTDAITGGRIKTSSYGEASKNPVATGAYTPSYYGGFSTSLNYKNFDLGATFSYSVGGEIYNYARAEFDSDGAYTDRNQMNLQKGWSRWEKPGDIATHPQAIYNNSSNSNKASSRFLEDGSYLKMRSLSLGYNLSIERLNISNLRIFVAGENLFTITKFSGVDPEIPPAGGSITGVATSVYPQIRRFVLGFNITL